MEETLQVRHRGGSVQWHQTPIYSPHRSCCTLPNFILYLYRQNKTVQSAEWGFHSMKEEVWMRHQRPATNRSPLRRRLRPSDVNLCSAGSEKINSADTFKVYGRKRLDPSGTTDGRISSTDVAINDRVCSDTLRGKTYSNPWGEKYCSGPLLG